MIILPEILELTFKSLHRPDLKNVRLTCKAFEKCATPLLFDQVVVSPNPAAFEIANLVIAHFRPHISTLVVFPVTHTKLTRREFKVEARELFQNDKKGDRAALEAHLNLWFRLYTKRCESEKIIYSSGEFVVQLCSAFSRVPGLRKLVIGQSDFHIHMRERHLRHLGIKKSDLCDVNNCQLGHEEHVKYQPHPYSCPNPDALNLLHPAMLALDTFGLSITELDMEYYYWRYQKETVACPLLSISAFDISNPHSRSLSNTFSRLRKLHLALDLTANGLEGLWEDVFLEGHAAMALSQARNLESLYIVAFEGDGDPSEESTFLPILGGCRFPKLTSLMLEGFLSEESELCQFIQASPDLRYLFMSDISLATGSWEKFADRVRPSLALHRVMLDNLYQVDGKDCKDLHYMYTKDSLEDFWLRCGHNPFTEKALTWTKDFDKNARRPMDQMHEHYQWIHQGLGWTKGDSWTSSVRCQIGLHASVA